MGLKIYLAKLDKALRRERKKCRRDKMQMDNRSIFLLEELAEKKKDKKKK